MRVALDGLAMQLRRSEVESVANGLGQPDAPAESQLIGVAEAVRRLPANDRAPVWELAVRHFGRRKPLAMAAGDIGMDLVLARDLVERFARTLATVSPAAP